MSETKSLAAPKATFDRRAVVKGVAWTVPVISLAIASPAAAASGTPTLTINGAGTAINFDTAVPPHHGTAPTSFTIDNPGVASTGAITGTITVTPTSSTPKKQARIGVKSASPGTATEARPDNTNNSITTTFSYATMPGKSSMTFPLGYSYARNGSETIFGDYTMVISLRLSTTPVTNLLKSASITETAV